MPRGTKIVEPMGNAHEIAEVAESLQPQYIEPTQYGEAQRQAGLTQERGAPRYTPDKYSKEIQLRNAIRQASSKSDIGGQVTVPVSDKEVAFLKRMYEQTQRAEYNRFIETAFDRSDPANRALFLKMFPDFARIRDQLIENEAEIQTKIAKLQVTGIQSEDDAKFVYALNQGTIKLPVRPLFDPTGGTLATFELYQNGPFAPPIEVRKRVALDDLNRKLGFVLETGASLSGSRPSRLTADELGIGENAIGDLAQQIADATYRAS